MLSNGLPPPENLLASICCCSLDRPGSPCLFEFVVCGACTSEVVDSGVGSGVDCGVDTVVDSDVDSDVGSGSPIPRTEDFGA